MLERISHFAATRATMLVFAIVVVAGVAGVCGLEVAQHLGEQARLSQVQTTAERRAVQVMSQTLDGTMMGAMSMLGLVDDDIKRETRGQLEPNAPRQSALLESIGGAFDAEGVFLVDERGIVGSSWDRSGKRSTGLDVKFRPYALMAAQGAESVYAAVSLATGKRALYFAAPVFSAKTRGSASTGAAVVRTGLAKVDTLLLGEEEVALLLSPQGVVFASNRPEWIGRRAGAATSERLEAIRKLKQFGNMFDGHAPEPLPVGIEPGIAELDGRLYAVGHSRVQWNDPFGDWALVLMEDLQRTLPPSDRYWVGAAAAGATLLLGVLMLYLLRARHAETLAARTLKAHAARQDALAERKSRIAAASMRLQRASNVGELAAVFLEEANRLLGVLQGTLYLLDGDDAARRLVLAAGFACPTGVPVELALGEGLPGQCAQDALPLIVDVPENGYWRISSGLGAARPKQVAVLPIQSNEGLLGVVELALLKPFDSDDYELLADLIPILALNLEIQVKNRSHAEMAARSLTADRELQRLQDIERFNRLAQGREQRILELKQEVNALAAALGQDAPYAKALVETIGDHVLPVSPDGFPAEAGEAIESMQLDALVDLNALGALFENFCEAVGVAAAIIDLEGKVLVSARWQRVCTDFHRVNPDSCARCIESDTELALELQAGQDFTLYRCKNGMTDCAAPIVVEGQHLANVFIGQFHLGPPDVEFFEAQAREFGYREVDYMQAVAAAPVLDESRLPHILGFLSQLARLVATMSLDRRRADMAHRKLHEQAEQLRRERLAAMSVAEDAEQARRMAAMATEQTK